MTIPTTTIILISLLLLIGIPPLFYLLFSTISDLRYISKRSKQLDGEKDAILHQMGIKEKKEKL